jgi:glutathionyl-hydroquinone reductase
MRKGYCLNLPAKLLGKIAYFSIQIFQESGRFVRPDSIFRNFISKDPNSQFPAEKGRYALYISPGCPWVNAITFPTLFLFD